MTVLNGAFGPYHTTVTIQAAKENDMVAILCLVAGVLLAFLLWNLFKLTFHLIVWGIVGFISLVLFLPGILLLFGGLGLALLTLLCTVGILYIISLFTDYRK
jgi:hypothetical protein